MGLVKVKMPNLGESVTEATVVAWQVKVGDQVEKYDALLEAQSDKVTTEIPSDYQGTVKEILIQEDETVPIGTEILVIEVAGEGESGSNESSEPEVESKPTLETTPSQAESRASAKPSNHSKGGRFSPAVLHIAQERGIDLSQIVGTGKGGRITRKDVINYEPTSAENKPTQVKELKPELVQTSLDPQPQPELKSEQNNKPVTSSLDSQQEIIKADGVRKAIAKKMVQSVTEIPHAWMQIEVDVSNIVALREKTKSQFMQTEGLKLSYFPFFVKAVAQALKKHPMLNSSWQDNNIVLNKDINLSIAIAAGDNLFVPVIKHVDNLSISGIAKEVDRLALKARSGKLTSEDMVGGTMTVNNTGTFGSVASMGIINYPQAAIIQVESINKRFVPTADGGFKAADMINLCLSFDHRILDGLAAGNFMKDVKENLQRFNNENDLY